MKLKQYLILYSITMHMLTSDMKQNRTKISQIMGMIKNYNYICCLLSGKG